MNETPKNTVKLLPDGYIDITLIGDQNYDTIERSARECLNLVEKLQFEHKPVLGIIDFSQHGGFNAGSNKAALEAMSSIHYDRLALFGADKLHFEVADLIIKALGQDDRTHVFQTREEAVAWVMMKDPLRG